MLKDFIAGFFRRETRSLDFQVSSHLNEEATAVSYGVVPQVSAQLNVPLPIENDIDKHEPRTEGGRLNYLIDYKNIVDRQAIESNTSGISPVSISMTEFGEEIDGYWFFPYRKHVYSDQGVKKWYAPTLVAATEVNAGFALVNLDTQPVLCEGFTLSARQLALIAHPHKTMAARVRLAASGLYCVVAEFTPCTWNGSVSVSTRANGQAVWEHSIESGDATARYVGYLTLSDPSAIHFAINSKPEGQTEYCRVGLKFAIFECDPATGAKRVRCDDQRSALDTEEALRWASEVPFAPEQVHGISVDIQSRADIFDRSWTLNRKYLASLFPKASAEIIEDVTKRRSEAPVKYVICMIPRSGSTLLGELLSSTGKLGYPIEYFVPDIVRSLSLPFLDIFPSYGDLIKTGFSTENGVFGAEVEGVRFFEEKRFFGNLDQWHVIYLTRNNILAQAISLAISERSGVWHSFGQSDKHGQCLLDNNTIKWQLNFLLENERNFENLFTESNVAPLRIAYENLVQDPAAEIRNIAEYVGVMDVEISGIDISNTVLKPTRTAVNRYYELMTVMTGGEFWGYNFYTIEGIEVAALTGVRVDLLTLGRDRAPLLFVDSDRRNLRERIEAYIVKRLADF